MDLYALLSPTPLCPSISVSIVSLVPWCSQYVANLKAWSLSIFLPIGVITFSAIGPEWQFRNRNSTSDTYLKLMIDANFGLVNYVLQFEAGIPFEGDDVIAIRQTKTGDSRRIYGMISGFEFWVWRHVESASIHQEMFKAVRGALKRSDVRSAFFIVQRIRLTFIRSRYRILNLEASITRLSQRNTDA